VGSRSPGWLPTLAPSNCIGPTGGFRHLVAGSSADWLADSHAAGHRSWVFARADEAFYVAGADNIASLHLHTALGFQEMKRFPSDRSAAGVDVLSRLTRAAASPDLRRFSDRD
jgi:hypothetical protein